MKHHLTYKDDKSDKFWNIEVSGKSFTVTYGKTGTAGQTQTKTFGSEEECQKEAKKLLSEKLKKGYAEGEILAKTKSASTGKKNQEPQADYLKEWENIVNAKDLHKALNEHFAYLADSPGYEKVLEAVMKEAICASIDGSYLIIDFPSDILCASHPPADLQQYENWPIRFRNLVSKHESLELDEAELFLGGRGEAGLYTNAHRLVDKDDSFVEKINWDKTPNDPSNKPVDDYYDPYADVLSIWYEDDPKHLEEDLAANEPREPSVGALFLARMSEILELYITPSSTKNDTEIKTNISFKPILKISRCVRQGLIYRNDLITLEPQVEKKYWEYYPESINRIAIYDIEKPSQPVLKAFFPLELVPYEMCIHQDRLFVFSAGYIEKGGKFSLSVYDITSNSEIVFLKELDSEIIPSNEKYNPDMKSFGKDCSILITGDYLLFSCASLGYEGLRGFEFRVYNIQTLECFDNLPIERDWPKAARLFENEVLQYVEKDLLKISVIENTLRVQSIFKWGERENGHGVYAKKSNFLYLSKDHDRLIYTYDDKGKQLSKIKAPGSAMYIGKIWIWENILIMDDGYFFFIHSDGSLVSLKSDWKPKDALITDRRNKLTFHENKILVPRLIRDKALDKTFEFQIFDMVLK